MYGMGFLCHSLFLRQFEIFANYLILLKNNSPIFKKMDINGKIAYSSVCVHNLLVFFKLCGVYGEY